MGAGIEMSARWMQLSADRVAPLMGAWIEMHTYSHCHVGCASLPSRERGSKYAHFEFNEHQVSRSPRGSVD